MKVNLFKLNKNKKFNYNPRYLKDKSNDNIYEFDSVYQKQKRSRSSYDISSKWSEERLIYRNRSNSSFSKTLIFIIETDKEEIPVITLIAGDRLCNTD